MTEQSRKAAAEEHVASAGRFLAAADVLAAAGLFDRASSQLYYWLFHLVRALLCTEGLEPRTHRGTQQLLHLHFVRAGLLGKEHLTALGDLQREREESDYLTAPATTEPEYQSLRMAADAAAAAIQAILAARGVS